MKNIILTVLIILSTISCQHSTSIEESYTVQQKEAYVSKVWVSDQGDGTFINPVLYADYSDPDVIRVNDAYFMTASSFNCMPGLPILYSRDLVNWTIVNYAIQKLIPEEVYKVPQHSKGIWAPSIRYHNNEFYIYWGDPDFGVYMINTKDPLGKWSNPMLVLAGKGIIDPCPLWNVPNLLLQKLPAPDFTVTTKLKLTTEWDTPGKTAGLLMMGQSYAYVGSSYHNNKYWVQQVTCEEAIDGNTEKINEERLLPGNEVYLRMQVVSPDALCRFFYSINNEDYQPLGEEFKATKDLWISAKMGIFSTSQASVRIGGYADFDWFKVSATLVE